MKNQNLCPKCNGKMKEIKVKIQDAGSPVISYQCGECGYARNF